MCQTNKDAPTENEEEAKTFYNKQRLPCYQYCIYDRDFSCSWGCGPPQLEPPIAKKRHLFPVAQWLQGAAAEQGGVPGNRPILPFAPSAVAMTL